jgi:hypothetical protein
MPKRGFKVARRSAIIGIAMRFRSILPAVLILTLSSLIRPSDTFSQRETADARQEDTLSESEIREMIRESADKDVENTKRQRDYTYVRRDERRKLDGKGRVKSTESKTYEVLWLAGEQVEKLIEENDKPLSEKDAQKEDKKVQKIVERGQKQSERDLKKRQEKAEKEAEEDRKFVREIADAYTFHFRGTEELDGRPTYVIDAEPLPGYKPRIKEAKVLSKVRFRVWVDKIERQWVKLDMECIDTISWGLFLARIHKGSTIQVEQTRVNDEVWLPKHVDLKVDAKIALLKNLDMQLDILFRDYQKFRTDAVIRPLGEVPD